jgi:hypothetical protein
MLLPDISAVFYRLVRQRRRASAVDQEDLEMSFLRNATFAALMGTLLASPALALDRRVTIINETGFTMTNFYGSNTGSKSWEEDILGQDVLPSGSQVVVNFNDQSGYCMFDFRAVFEDGDELIREKVNVCETSTFTYN